MGHSSFKLREDYMRGIPSFVLQQATEKYIDEIRQHVFKHILSYKSNSEDERVAAIAAADEALDDLEKKVTDVMEESLRYFMMET